LKNSKKFHKDTIFCTDTAANDDYENALARALEESIQFEQVRSRKDRRKQQTNEVLAINGDNAVTVNWKFLKTFNFAPKLTSLRRRPVPLKSVR
jgi:threonine aldolase